MDSEKVRSILNRERHLILVVTNVIGAFFICWAPFWIVYLVIINLQSQIWELIIGLTLKGTIQIPADREQTKMGVATFLYKIPFLKISPLCVSEWCSGISKLSHNWLLLFQWIGYTNSIINPIIYTVFQRDLRLAIVSSLKYLCTRN